MSLQTIKPISLDLYNNVLVSINAKQQDTESRYVKIICTDNGKKSVLNRDEVRAFIRYKKPDGHYVLNDADITEDGCVLVELTQQMLAIPGQAKADVLLADISKLNFEITDETDLSSLKTSLLTTMFFYVNILHSAIDGSEIESSYEYSALLDTMMRMVVLEKELTDFKQTIIEEEELRKASETTRTENEDERIANEIERNNKVDTALSNIEKTINDANKYVADTILDANTKIDNAVSAANTATSNANTATENANTAKEDAEIATTHANDAAIRANTAAEACEGIVDGSNVILKNEKGVANGVATLDLNVKIPVDQLPNMDDGNSIQDNFDSINKTVSELGESVQGNADAIDTLNEKSHSHTKPGDGGSWWNNGTPIVASNGVMEVGKFIDFHHTNDTTNDYSTRLLCNGDNANTIYLPASESGTLALAAQTYNSTTSRTKNTVLAAPNGSDGSATFRSLVEADLPYPDYVVAQGTSGNWRYTKWASGLAICHHNAKTGGNWYGEAWGGVYDDESAHIAFDDYPFEFKESPFAFASKTRADSTTTEGDMHTLWAWIAMQGGSATSPPRFQLVRGSTATIGNPYLKMVAIGRWK